MSSSTAKKPKYKVIGTRPVRHDGADKVTGRAIYGADVQLPGWCTASIVRSPHAHARIKSIDTSARREAARRAGGRHGGRLSGPGGQDRRPGRRRGQPGAPGGQLLARDKVLYKGHAVAAVAATSPHVAEEAAKLIKVEYELLPSVTWVLDAMKRRRAAAARRRAAPTRWARRRDKPSNVADAHPVREWATSTRASPRPTSSSSASSRRPACIRATSSRTSPTALWNEDGRLTIWTATQGSFTARQQAAELLQIPVSQVHGRAVRDRRRLRRQDRGLPGAGRGAARAARAAGR